MQLTSRSAACGRSTASPPRSAARRSARALRAVPHEHLGCPCVEQRPHRGARAAARAEHLRAEAGDAIPERGDAARARRCSRPRSCRRRRSSACSRRRSCAPCRSPRRRARAPPPCAGSSRWRRRSPRAPERAHRLVEQLRRHRQALVAPVASARARRARRSASPASGCARPASRGRRAAASAVLAGRAGGRRSSSLRRFVGGDVFVELRFGRREHLLAAAVGAGDVVQVGDVRRVRGRLDRGDARVGDRRRRQAWCRRVLYGESMASCEVVSSFV